MTTETEKKAAYREYLESDHWKLLRSETLAAYGKKCQCCDSKKKIQVHHLQYRDLFSVTVEDLRPVCDGCHELAHAILKTLPPHYTPAQKWDVCRSRIMATKKIRKETSQTFKEPIPNAAPCEFWRQKKERKAAFQEIINDVRVHPKKRLTGPSMKGFVKRFYFNRDRAAIIHYLVHCGGSH